MVGKVTPDTILSCSRLPAVLSLSRYRTPNDELEASIAALRGEERPDIGNEAMGWGNKFEAEILNEAAWRLQLSDVETEHPEARFHDSLPLCCSLDGTGDGRGQVFTTDPDQGIYVMGQDSITLDGIGVLEAKLTSVKPEEFPALYRGPVQLQGQMDIVKAKWGAVCVLYQGVELRVFLFAPHHGTLEMISQAVLDFQARLDRFKADGTVDYYPPANGEKWFQNRGPFPIDKEPVQLGPDVEELAKKIHAARQQIKQMETDLETDEEKLAKILGACEVGIAGRYQVSRPTRSYRAQPAKTVPARDAYTIRQSTVSIKELKDA